MGKKIKNKLRGAAALLAVIALTALPSGCAFKSQPEKRYPLKLEIWGLFDDRDAFHEIFDSYRKSNPNILEINYRKLTADTYRRDLLEALASGQGPDIFLIHNTWLSSFRDKIVPVSPEILNEQKYRAEFADVVIHDFVEQGKIYAAPLSVDALGLFYNKDLFNQAGITEPPATWSEFVEDVKLLTRIDGGGQIRQSGAAIGTAYNINRSTDILNLLFLQKNTRMLDEMGRRAVFDMASGRSDGENVNNPGLEALNFYTSFAKANSAFYSWNKNMHYSIDAFSEGNLAMMLNYSWQIDAIRSKAPKLNFAVAPVPQLSPDSPANFANYWGYAVSKNKKAVTLPNQPPVPDEARVAESWKFLKFLSSKPEVFSDKNGNLINTFDAAKAYAKKTNRPAARRDIIEEQKTDPKIGVFAKENLIAKNWKQADSVAIEAIFAAMIDAVNRGAQTPYDALKAAAAQVTQIMGR